MYVLLLYIANRNPSGMIRLHQQFAIKEVWWELSTEPIFNIHKEKQAHSDYLERLGSIQFCRMKVEEKKTRFFSWEKQSRQRESYLLVINISDTPSGH